MRVETGGLDDVLVAVERLVGACEPHDDVQELGSVHNGELQDVLEEVSVVVYDDPALRVLEHAQCHLEVLD